MPTWGFGIHRFANLRVGIPPGRAEVGRISDRFCDSRRSAIPPLSRGNSAGLPIDGSGIHRFRGGIRSLLHGDEKPQWATSTPKARGLYTQSHPYRECVVYLRRRWSGSQWPRLRYLPHLPRKVLVHGLLSDARNGGLCCSVGRLLVWVWHHREPLGRIEPMAAGRNKAHENNEITAEQYKLNIKGFIPPIGFSLASLFCPSCIGNCGLNEQ